MDSNSDIEMGWKVLGEKKRGYKIFSLSSNALISLTSSAEVHTFVVGMWTRPKKGCGPFAVLKTHKDVRNFKAKNGWTHAPVYTVMYEASDGRELFNLRGKSCSIVPEGTDFADAVYVENCLGE